MGNPQGKKTISLYVGENVSFEKGMFKPTLKRVFDAIWDSLTLNRQIELTEEFGDDIRKIAEVLK